jgi:peptide/nickel transport system substrate-binding protein
MPATDVRLLGPIEVTLDGHTIAVGAAKQRAVLAMLALRPNAVVSVGELVEGLWGEEPPASAVKLIQHYVSQLRKLLAGGDAEIVTRGRGYELRVRPDAIDAACFERLADAAARGDPGGTAARDALALWRGDPLSDVIDEPFAAAELRRLEDLWLGVTERAIAGELDAGRHDEVIARLDDLVARHPLREHLHVLRMRALYAAGRQAEALEAYRRARAVLVEEVGIEPGRELRELHEAMLRQDPELAPPRARRPPPPRRRPWALPVAAAALLVAGVVAFAVIRIAAPDQLDGLDENAVGQIDLGSAHLVGQYLVGREPRALATGAGSLWVADAQDGTVSRVEPKRVVTIPVGPDPVALAFGDGALWVAEQGDRTVAQVSPASNRVIRRVDVANAPTALAVGYGSVWVASAVDQTVTRIPIGAPGASPAIHLGAPASAIAAGAGAVWATSEESGTLFRIAPDTGAIVKAIRVGNRPVAVAAAASGVWVVNRQDATVWRIDPATDRVTDTIAVGRDPGAIAAAGRDVWVAAGAAAAWRIDGRSRRVTRKVALGNPAAAIAAGGGSLWAATQPSPARHRGGTVTFRTEPFADGYPGADSYDDKAYQVLSLAYDGLVAYRRTGGTTFGPLVGDLAIDVPEPSADGRTYVFRLRRGIRFSDGSPLEPADFRASLEDLLRRHGRALPAFFESIVGARRCAREPRACDLKAGVAIDPRERTITLRLTRPDPNLLHKLATPLAYVAPARQPFRPDRPAPGTGPYRFAALDRTHGLALTRNPHFRVWSPDARPDGLADRIDVQVAETLGTSVAAVERGDVDVVTLADPFGPAVPNGEIQTLAARHPERLHTTATPSLVHLWMNVHEPPFDDVRVRRAVNYAIDRGRVAELDGGDPLAGPACHFVAPGHPGYSPVCRYTRNPRAGIWSAPDMERARALIARSHTAGRAVTVHVPEDRRAAGRYIAGLLGRLGYPTRLRVFHDYQAFHTYVADSRRHAQVGTDGWAADFPSPVDFTAPFRCGSYTPRSSANINLSGLCDRGLEHRIDAALAARGAEADDRWRGVYDALARAAPAAPLVNRRGAVYTSARLGNYQHHPLFGVLLDQVWVR